MKYPSIVRPLFVAAAAVILMILASFEETRRWAALVATMPEQPGAPPPVAS